MVETMVLKVALGARIGRDVEGWLGLDLEVFLLVCQFDRRLLLLLLLDGLYGQWLLRIFRFKRGWVYRAPLCLLLTGLSLVRLRAVVVHFEGSLDFAASLAATFGVGGQSPALV